MNTILVFAREPQPGKVKTRLAAHIGPEAAACLYAAMLRDTLLVAQTAAQKSQGEVVLSYTPDDAFDDAFASNEFSLADFWKGAKTPQKGADLGEKMRFAIENRLAQGAKKVLIIGSDKPDLESALLCEAFEKLNQHDLVFGPAHDGGFYLIGARAPLPRAVFESVVWSHPSTLHRVLGNVRSQNLSVALLPLGGDVDEWRDLQNFIADTELKSKAPYFHAALCELNLL